MSRRTTAIAAALFVLALGSPWITCCTNPLATQYFNQGVEKYEAGGEYAIFNDYVNRSKYKITKPLDKQDADAAGKMDVNLVRYLEVFTQQKKCTLRKLLNVNIFIKKQQQKTNISL